MTALINTNLRAGYSLGSVSASPEGEALRAREAAGGSMSRPPLDSLPLRKFWTRCYGCQKVLNGEDIDSHWCPWSL